MAGYFIFFAKRSVCFPTAQFYLKLLRPFRCQFLQVRKTQRRQILEETGARPKRKNLDARPFKILRKLVKSFRKLALPEPEHNGDNQISKSTAKKA